MIVELRIYHCLPGRLPALLERFRSTTLDYFAQYGIEQIGFWTTQVGESNHTLTYLLRWESMAERDARWSAFQHDSGWVEKRTESEREKPIVAQIENSFLSPTDFSALR
ncbi:hypothetical protein Sant_P0358 (plasmid) [Sodalis praecaptivus]|uniref:NIPSNAP domain-containing protein n=1 Tax=Sodalis praecaptivus TaxID=1239307 RepID=W0I4R9_9GAMM|nr:NIPSNAP family protein [Sodalis praecaptivus]AHF79393.1 hypothetical protein Sant_P0358 [Sodalis praecaptivus]